MDVLQDERKRVLAPVARARLAHRARRRIRPERLVVGAAVVVAGQPEKRRDRQDEQRRRKRQPRRPRRRLRSEPAVRRRAEELRRVERREVRSERVVVALERRPRRVDEERRQSQEHEQRLDPPGVAARGFAKPAHGQPDRCSQRGHATESSNERPIADRQRVRRSQGSPIAADAEPINLESAHTILAPAADFKSIAGGRDSAGGRHPHRARTMASEAPPQTAEKREAGVASPR